MSLEIKTKKIKNYPALELVGRIIDVDVDKFTKKIEALCKKNPERIILDVTKTNFIDSHGIGIIVYYNTILMKKNRELVILNCNLDKHGYVRRLFELTNLDKVLRTVNDVSEL